MTLPTTFDQLDLLPALRPGLDALAISTLTPVQAEVLPAALAGSDVQAQAPTGSGKTVAFALPLLQRIDLSLLAVQALVLCPTRELADQVGKQIRKLGTGLANLKLSLFYGGTALAPQIASLAQHDPHIVVGTPGRIQELLRKKHLHLRRVRVLVLDEADRMLDMGFEPALREIVRALPAERQTMLFSATFSAELGEVAAGSLRAPLQVRVDAAESLPEIDERFHEVAHRDRIDALEGLLRAEAPASCVVFCNTRQDVDAVAAQLASAGISALALHGDIEQRDREEVLLQFANGSARVLCASDVAARGLDIDALEMVVNFELPNDLDTYRHRIGRTGRAGRSGRAHSLVTAKEMPRALALERQAGQALRWTPLPSGRSAPLPAPMVTLRIDAGRTDKLRPGDVLGALTGEAGLTAAQVGKIDVFPTRSYVAIARECAGQALKRLQAGKIKGRSFRVRRL